MSTRWPDATAATHRELARMATALNYSGWSHIERLQVLLERVAITYHGDGPEAAAAEVEQLVRRDQYRARFR
jgi:hypothetical protein